MGALTRAEIVAAALTQAGNTGLTTQMNLWLNTWLRDQALGWNWTCNQRELSGLALSNGVSPVSFGGGSGGESLEVRYISDPLFLYSSAYDALQEVRVRSFKGSILSDETVLNPLSNKGTPRVVKCLPDSTTQGKWNLYFTPIPDRAYLAKIQYSVIPANISADATKPWYPNDETMLEYLVARARHRDEGGEVAWQLTAAKVREDRTSDMQSGYNDVLELDGGVFR